MTGEKKNRKLISSEGVVKQLSAYSAAAGAVLLMVTPSEAAVHVFVPATHVTVDGSKVGLDLMSQTQNDGNADFSFTGAAVKPLGNKNAFIFLSSSNTYFVKNLAAGAVIGTAGPGMASAGAPGKLMNSGCHATTHSTCHSICQPNGTSGGQTCQQQCTNVDGQACSWGRAEFNDGASGYIGVTFQAKDKSQHTGWIHYTGGTTLDKFSGAIDSWAYEDKAGWPIQMGSSTTLTQVDVTASAGSNGSIKPAGDVKINVEGSQTFEFTPANGYVVSAVSLDGRTVGKLISSYTLKKVNEPHTISVSFAELPIADGGPAQTVNELETVTLVGTGSSDPNGGQLTYHWKQVRGPSVELTDPTAATTTFTAPLAPAKGESLQFQLTVTDSVGLSASSECTVTVKDVPPTAVIKAPATVAEGLQGTLDGTASSDSAGDTIKSYLWTLKTYTTKTKPTLHNATKSIATFTAPTTTGALTFQLKVTDRNGLSGANTCIVNATPTGQATDAPNTNVTRAMKPPVAAIAPLQPVKEGDAVVLDGSSSYDDDDGIALYKWKLLSVNGASPVTVSGDTTSQATFTAPNITGNRNSASLVFELTVTGHGGLSASKTCTVTVTR